MADRNRELVLNSRSLVRESADHWTLFGRMVFRTRTPSSAFFFLTNMDTKLFTLTVIDT